MTFKIPALTGLAAVLALSSCTRETEATADLGDGVTVVMSVTPMFGIHSDWHRTLTIFQQEEQVALDLAEDTGWWRGSHLYLHSSGAFVLHEGQMGCLVFTVDVVPSDARNQISCAKSPAAAEASAGRELNGYPASRYYESLFYVGRFAETSLIPDLRDIRDDMPIVFQRHEEQDEQELPARV